MSELDFWPLSHLQTKTIRFTGVDLNFKHHSLLSEFLQLHQHLFIITVWIVTTQIRSVSAVVRHHPQVMESVGVLRAARRSIPQPSLYLGRRHWESTVHGRSHQAQAVCSPSTPPPCSRSLRNNRCSFFFLLLVLPILLFIFLLFLSSSVLLLSLLLLLANRPSYMSVHLLEKPSWPSVVLGVRGGHGEGGSKAGLRLPLLLRAALWWSRTADLRLRPQSRRFSTWGSSRSRDVQAGCHLETPHSHWCGLNVCNTERQMEK